MVLTQQQQESWIEVTVERPKALNALNHEVLAALLELVQSIKEPSATCRAVIITGSGEKAFVAGADIAAMSGLNDVQIAEYVELGQNVMHSLESCPVPIIAAVNGFALGGGMELALACDLIIAADTAKFGQPEVNLGIIPGFGGTQRILQRSGVGVARRLVYTGQIISATEALSVNLIDQVVPSVDLMQAARSVAKVIASKAPDAIRIAKRVIFDGAGEQLKAGLTYEVQGFLELFQSDDRVEGMNAFLEKRPAKFTC